MKKIFTCLSALFGMLLFSAATHAQDAWPKVLEGSDGSVIKIYQFQPESFSNNQLKANAAISIAKAGNADPVFGVAWFEAVTSTSGDQVQIESINISSIKLPGDITDESLDALQTDIEDKTKLLDIKVPLAELQSSIELNNKQQQLSSQISNKAPKVIYSTSPSILVLIDGEPKIQHNASWGVDAVVNTPFTLVKNKDGKYYLYGGKHWYMAPAASGPYSLTTTVPAQLRTVEEKVKSETSEDNDAKEKDENTIYKIIVSTQPAELIQSVGEPKFAPIENSGLLYVSNSVDDIFMDVNSQNYYVLISGRWYHSKTLSGSWEYTGADKLPEDFAKIPEGSPKDHVLASIAGTDAANDALQEAAVPQTAKVDRNSAQAEVTYDGDPRFEDIDGTELEYAVNTPASVVRWRGRYYSVDNGIWFEASRPTGPWVVSVSRPYAVALIPPSYPVYHMKYVYIYDVTPDYVYMGYTPGYLNTFVYGPTVVYGTGFYYRPWFGRHYYARPYTWGFNVRYNPWIGWGLDYRYSTGWFNVGFSIGHRPWGYWSGGWWGPRFYRPAYCWSPVRYGGSYYGRNNVYYNRGRNYNIVNRNYSGNIYRNRGGVISRDYQRTAYNPARTNRNRDWSAGNRYNNRGGSNYNNRNNTIGSRPSDRPVREYNPNRRNDPYNRNGVINRSDNNNNNRTRDRVTPRDQNRNNRYNNTNRDPYNNRNANPSNRGTRPNSVTPGGGSAPGNETTMPGRISRPDRGSRLHTTPDNNNRTVTPGVERQPRVQRQEQPRIERQQQPRVERQQQPRVERQVQPRAERQYQPQREVQRREPARQPTVRQSQDRGGSNRGGGNGGGARSGGDRGSRGGRPDRN